MLTRTRPRRGIAALRRFAQARPVERCELCAAPIGEIHAHLLETATGRLLCACPICAATAGERADGRYRRVPRRVEALPEFRLSDAEWHALGVPIDMAWFYHSTQSGRPVALYPGAAGAAQSLPGPEAWGAMIARNPCMDEFEPDVEALLVNRLGGRRLYFRVPIDRCYELAGLIRMRWQGWSGGDGVWQAIDGYFARLAAEAGGGERAA